LFRAGSKRSQPPQAAAESLPRKAKPVADHTSCPGIVKTAAGPNKGARRWRQQLFLLATAILISPAAAYSCWSD
jgi:hypothetical protein